MLRTQRHTQLVNSYKRLINAQSRSLRTLAIETSCDDTAVAVLETHDATSPNNASKHQPGASVLFSKKITSDNRIYGGIHPSIALGSHQSNLATLVNMALTSTKSRSSSKLDFITVTRGPGMVGSLSVGVELAKGLAVGLRLPLVAVNHMQAHALTPRLVGALNNPLSTPLEPRFPFLSLLVSGGHTMLVKSETLTEHPILASTVDIAIGDYIDKCARFILPPEVMTLAKTTMYGPLLEAFAFPNGRTDYDYEPHMTQGRRSGSGTKKWGWNISAPFSNSRGGFKHKAMEYSFTGTCAGVQRIMETSSSREITIEERRDLSREAMRIAFEHLVSRVILALENDTSDNHRSICDVKTLVLSGGVAANKFLKHVVRQYLDASGYSHIDIVTPPVALCTDNAEMIGWTGIEMYKAGWTSDLGCRALRKWTLDSSQLDGGILGISHWKLDGQDYNKAVTHSEDHADGNSNANLSG